MTVPNALLIPFSAHLLTIPRSKNTKIVVQINIEIGVERTPKKSTNKKIIAQTPKTVAQIKALLPHIFVLSIKASAIS